MHRGVSPATRVRNSTDAFFFCGLILHGTICYVELALWLHGSVFFSRLRLGVALAFGRFLRDFAVRTRGREALQRSIFAVGASSAAMRRV